MHIIEIKPTPNILPFSSVKLWIDENCKGNWYGRFEDKILKYSFEKEEDAIAFKLRWS